MSRLTVLAYDIADDARRNHVAKVCEHHMLRVQESVFEAWLSAAELQRLIHALRPHLDPAADTVRIYPLALRDLARRKALGPHPQAQPLPDYILV